MGAHPKAPSLILSDGGEQALDAWLKEHPEALGTAAELPFLMKVLAADAPLSIQAHPNREQAKAGFERENALGISLDHPKRNYKDPNHKPELICALSPFTALCGFRPHSQIIAGLRLSGLDELLPAAQSYIKSPSQSLWKSCFEAILRLSASDVLRATQQAVKGLGKAAEAWTEEPLTMVRTLAEFYPGDAGALAPLYLWLVDLLPGQALFLDAGIPHAYLKGAGIEVMASSDNVLRGGLTPKHMDIDELMKVIRFEPLELKIITAADGGSGLAWFDAPVQEFRLGVVDMPQAGSLNADISGPAILLCLKGDLRVEDGDNGSGLSKGEAVFVDAGSTRLHISGCGKAFISSAASLASII